MVTDYGHIIEATELELYEFYIRQSLICIMSFEEFISKMIADGCKVMKYTEEDIKRIMQDI